ncbi:autotransporter domain-containing protein [Hyphomicrobium sp. LHD-15]|uniref:autotransporter outer membrane beta-barrel domain-containing protein n=1 Tax=Hyphomicrobium sp. LHD-15 TaxID=3072142 RepID=UPI002810485F|nr:autotransporter domain-containing protein [Hyphomicrobium sp. LHD-15]MDQ8700066.1 autotransporter domain-containing protein [Hyphomicrobium sp. LHD-15]
MTGTHQECTGAADGTQLTLGDSSVVSSIHIHDLTQTFIALAGCAIDLYHVSGVGSLSIDVNSGSFGIESVQYGLTATVTTGPGSVTIGNIGSVTSGSTHAAIYGETRGGGALNITTNGDLSGGLYGIWAKTSNSSGTAGVISVISNGGDISGTTYGILVDTPTASHVTINGGSVYGGDTGITFSTRSSGTITNYGTISGGAYAITMDDDDDTINNYGVIRGNVFMSHGDDVFNNSQSGTVESASSLAVETFVNRGILSPGGASVQTTQFSGDLNQTSTGRYLVSLAESSGSVTADRIDISGNATLAGTVVVQTSGNLGASGSIVIASSDGDLTNNLGAVRRSGGYAYTLSATYGATDYLTLNWLLAPGGVVDTVNETGSAAPNQQATAAHLDRIAEGGGGTQTFDDMVSDVASMTSGQAQQAVERLSPEHYAQRMTDTSQSYLAFVNSAMSCPTLEQNPGFIQEGQCYWAKVGGRQLGWDKTDRNVGGDEEAWTMSGGVQVALRDEWRLGFAGSYEHSNVSTNNSAATETDRAQGAVILKNRWDTVSFAATAFVGYGWSDTQRHIGFGGLGTAESDNQMWYAGTQVRLSQLFEQAGGWYVKPMIDLNATRLQTEDFREHGAGAANLAVQGDSTWVLTASPALEIGAEMRAGGLVLRPFVRVGATFFQDAVYETTASFISAPGTSFTIGSEFDKHYLDLAVGVDVLNAAGVDVKLTYDGRFSEHSDMHAGGIKAALPF